MNIPAKEKVIELTDERKRKGEIVVTHITIRQSIFFLVLKLFLLELSSAAIVVAFYFLIIVPKLLSNLPSEISFFYVPLYLLAVFLKTFIMFYVVIDWLEEYYEISTSSIFHRKGFLIKKEESFKFDHIGSLKLEQDILGRIFNYGTLRLYDWVKDESIYLYLVHNPLKYYRILKDLIPEADVEEKMLRRHVVDVEDED